MAGFVDSIVYPMSNIDLVLHSNIPPTATQREHILAMIAETTTMVEKISQENHEPESYAMLPILTSRVTVYKRALSAIRSLPVEILVMIFSLALADQMFLSTRRLCSVCSRWRTIFRNSPPLWTKLHLQYHGERSVDAANDLELVKEWFQRASPYPVQVFLSAGRPPIHRRPFSYENFSTNLSPLLTQAVRIKTLDLRLHRGELIIGTLYPNSPLSFPILEDLRIEVIIDRSEDLKPEARRVSTLFFLELLHTSCLTKMHLRIGYTFPTNSRLYMQLTELTLFVHSVDFFEDDRPTNMFAALARCVRLVTLTIELGTYASFSLYDGQVVLPELEHFRLDTAGFANTLDECLQPFVLPRLTTLRISLPGQGLEPGGGGLPDLRLRSQFSLRKLYLAPVEGDLDEEDIWSLIQDMKTLETLDLGCWKYAQEFLPHLRSPEGTLAFPNLCRLDVGVPVDPDDDTRALAYAVEDIVLSRWWTDDVPRKHKRWDFLRFVGTNGAIVYSPWAKMVLKAIKDQGLDLHLDWEEE